MKKRPDDVTSKHETDSSKQDTQLPAFIGQHYFIA